MQAHDLTAEPARALGPALAAGLRRRCPNCGRGAMFSGWLTVRDQCPDCAEALHHHRADDLPPYLSILLTGHVLVVSILIVETNAQPPLWLAFILWPALALGLSLGLLGPLKGAVVALQWALRMHGFGAGEGPGDRVERADG